MTNKWYVDESDISQILIGRVWDGIPICKMFYEDGDNDGILTREQAMDIANQIVDDWNFGCDELEK